MEDSAERVLPLAVRCWSTCASRGADSRPCRSFGRCLNPQGPEGKGQYKQGANANAGIGAQRERDLASADRSHAPRSPPCPLPPASCLSSLHRCLAHTLISCWKH